MKNKLRRGRTDVGVTNIFSEEVDPDVEIAEVKGVKAVNAAGGNDKLEDVFALREDVRGSAELDGAARKGDHTCGTGGRTRAEVVQAVVGQHAPPRLPVLGNHLVAPFFL